MPQEIIVVEKGGGGKLPLLIAALGGIAAAVWWFFNRGGGWGSADSSSPGNLQLRLTGSGLTLNGQSTTVDMAIASARESNTGIDVTITGDARTGDVDATLTALAASGVAFQVNRPTTIKSGGFYRLGNS